MFVFVFFSFCVSFPSSTILIERIFLFLFLLSSFSLSARLLSVRSFQIEKERSTMKVSILVILIVLPMLASIGLYCYAFISTRWSRLDHVRLQEYTSTNGRQRSQATSKDGSHVQLESQSIRHAFRSRYGLFGYCLEYKWLNLQTLKPTAPVNNDYYSQERRTPAPKPFCRPCNQSLLMCPETGCCVSSERPSPYAHRPACSLSLFR